MTTINFIMDIIASVIDAFVMERFLFFYFGGKMNKRSKQNIAMLIEQVILFIGAYFFSNYIFLQSALLIIILFTYTQLALSGSWKEHLLICVIEFMVSILVALFVMQMIMLIFHFTQTEAIFGDGVQHVITICMNRIVFIYSYFVILNLFSKRYNLRKNEWVLSATYFTSSIAISIILLVNTVFGIHNNIERAMDCLVTILLILTTIASMYMVDNLSKKNEITLQNEVLTLQLEKERTNILGLNREYSRAKIMRHDMNKQLNIYLSLLKNGEVEQTIKGLEQQLLGNDVPDYIFIKGNNFLSAVISEKSVICKKNSIEFAYEISTVISADKEMDLSILISNLLDNAIEAEMKLEKNRNIRINLFDRKGMLHIIVKNYIDQSILLENPHLYTDKEDKELHGYGIKSIETTTKKYNGMIQYSEEKHDFIAHMMVMN